MRGVTQGTLEMICMLPARTPRSFRIHIEVMRLFASPGRRYCLLVVYCRGACHRALRLDIEGWGTRGGSGDRGGGVLVLECWRIKSPTWCATSRLDVHFLTTSLQHAACARTVRCFLVLLLSLCRLAITAMTLWRAYHLLDRWHRRFHCLH
jgi:hypothetical protein